MTDVHARWTFNESAGSRLLPPPGFGAMVALTSLIGGRRTRCVARAAIGARSMNHPIPPPLLMSRLDVERIEALLELPIAEGIDTSALEAELERAEVVEPGQMPDDVITMNTTARFRDETNGEEHELTLVYPRDADGSPDKVSILAP